MSTGFTPRTVTVTDNLDGTWTLHDLLLYAAIDGRSFIVPAGFVTDFGSVPGIFDWIIPSDGFEGDPAYVLHDWLYSSNRHGKPVCKSRKDADLLLLEALQLCGVNRARRYAIYWGVRAGGWAAWK